ncbi:CMRF35-like molecule 5 isoform X2 [Heteronotia binoei]|uniref:CMRF35-like molecule 5 isoform X2 n=1 Tax=Heteronotia binoei TaxID=13085 RepID=UPI0029319E17|nr:CMRF35-like molecule 5 isoform X2 [Heteronotia binoei]
MIRWGFTSALRGPGAVHGFVGRSIHVTCHYDTSYQTYYKYWCKGASWNYCTEVVKTTGSEAEMKSGRTSIKDNHTCSCFTVILENLGEADAGMYWCAIERTGIDSGIQVIIAPILSTPQTTDVPDNRGHSGSLQKSKSSISYPIYVPFLILICLKMPVFLTLVLANIWIHRRNRQHSDEVTTPETQP